MEKMTEILSKLLTIAVLIFLPVVVLILLTSNTTIIPNLRSFVVLSGSMEPVIPVGSIVFSKKSDSYNLGEILSFTNSDNSTVTHRVVEKVKKPDGLYYRVEGDANNAPDVDLVAEKSVIGREVFSLPYLGRFVHFLRTPPGFILFILLPTFIYIVMEMWNIKKEVEKEVEKKVIARLKEHESK